MSTVNPIPDLTDRLPDPDALETRESRRARYRQQLLEKQEGKQVRLKTFLLGKRKYFRGVDPEARRKHLSEIQKMCRYYNGDHYSQENELGQLESLRKDGDFAYSIPILNGHVEQAFMQLYKTEPEYEITADDEDDVNLQMLAKACEELGVKDLKRLMNASNRLNEIYNTIFAGESYRNLEWGVDPRNPKVTKRTTYKREEYEIPGRRECQACHSDVPEGAKECPKEGCGATFIKDVEPGTSLMLIPQETDVRLGENQLHIPHMTSIQRDLSALEFEYSTFIIETDFLDKQVAEFMYQTIIEKSDLGFRPESTARFEMERSGIQMDANIGSNNWQTITSAVPVNKVERERIFMDASEYGQFYLEVDEVLPNGKTLKAGKFLNEYYPKGAYYVVLGNTIVDIDDAEKCRRWSIVRYGKKAGTSIGAGHKIVIPMQDAIDDDFNQSQTVKMTLGQPWTVIDGKSVEIVPGAGKILKTNRPGVDVRTVASQFPGQSVRDDGMQEKLASAMQFVLGTYTLGAGGAADQQNTSGTATEVAARVEQQSGRMIGPNGQRISADQELIFQCLENRRDYSSPEQKQELAKRFGDDIAELFFQCNFRQVMSIGVKANTDVPRSMALNQANMIAFGQIAAGFAKVEVPWANEILSMIGDAMGIPFSVGPGRNDRREAEYRLNKLVAIEDQIRSEKPEVLTNTALCAQLMYAALSKVCYPLIARNESMVKDAPRVFMQDHDSFKDVYHDALMGEKAKSWSDAHRAVVLQLWMDHYTAQIMQKQEEAALMAEMQQTLNPPPDQPTPEDMATQQQDQDQRALAEMAITHQGEEEKADAAHQRALEAKGVEHDLSEEAKDADMERKLVEQGHAAQTQMEVNKAKPKTGATQ